MAYSDEVTADSPVGWWKLNEASGNFADSSGNGNAMTVTGSPTRSQTGIPGDTGNNATAFTASNTYASLGSLPSVLQVSNWTLEGWVMKLGSIGLKSSILTEKFTVAGNGVRYMLGGYGDGTANRMSGGWYTGTVWRRINDTSDLPSNVWVHLAVTWDGTTIRFYRNGVEIGNTVPTGAPGSQDDLYIARGWDATNNPNLRLAHAAIYGSALSVDRLNTHVAVGFGRQFTADAVIRPSFSANAVIRKTISASFASDAATKRSQTGSFTEDAALAPNITSQGSFTADGILFRNISSSLAQDAVFKAQVSASLTQDAVLVQVNSASITGNAVIKRAIASSGTANAVIKRLGQASSFTANADIEFLVLRFTADAVIGVNLIGNRWQHHRLRDHFGLESDLFIGLSERLGPWEEGTPLHFVLEDLISRMDALESSTHNVSSFTGDGIVLAPGGTVSSSGTVRSVYFADAVLKKIPSRSFTAQAFITRGGSFTANANIRFQGSLTADASLV